MARRYSRKRRNKSEDNIDLLFLQALVLTLIIAGVFKVGQCVYNSITRTNTTPTTKIENVVTEQSKEEKVNKVSHQQPEIPVKQINQKEH